MTDSAAPRDENETVAVPSTASITAMPSSVGPMGVGDDIPPEVAGYDVHRMAGRGGMGVVWEATEHRLKRRVAIKVHVKNATPEQVVELWSEAQIAAKIGHPGIVAVHDFGYTLAGDPYYTMDFVEGTELRALLRDGPMAPNRAIAIAQEIASAVAAAHARGIVHCDIKPGNILVDAHGHVRILDFGLAVKVGADHDGAIRGSLRYMAPEQASGLAVTAATDVYAIGLVFYEMLAGRRPFVTETVDELLLLVASVTPEAPSKHAPVVHEDLDRICLVCLEKMAEDRYATAAALYDDLLAVAEGRPLTALKKAKPAKVEQAIVKAPTSALAAPARDAAKIHYKWTYDLATAPDKLWPFAANTERFNKAVGLPTAEFTDAPDDRGGVVRTGHIERLGMNIFWEEQPFQWVRHAEHSVFRRYQSGPFVALWNRVALAPKANGGTELVHEVWIEPRGFVGRIAAFFEVGFKASRSFRQVYRRIDDVLSKTVPEDPFEAPYVATPEQRAHVERATARVACPGEHAPELLQKLTRLLLDAPTKSLERLRPYALADKWDAGREETLQLLLHAAHAGLVDIAWDVVCPSCQIAHERTPKLSNVHRAGNCAACLEAYDRDLARHVELIFRPNAAVREVSEATYCAGSPAMRPHVFVQQILEAGDVRSFTIDLPRGEYRMVGPRVHGVFELTVSPSAYGSSCELRLADEDIRGTPVVVKPGPVTFVIENATGEEQTIRLEQSGQREDAVTASIAMTHPSFHDFFSAELIAQGEHLTVGRMAFLYVEVVDRGELIQKRGDAAAFALLDRIDEEIANAVREAGGVSVDASLHTCIASFSEAENAVRAAIILQDKVFAEGVELRVAVHAGHCIARTRASRIDYFGETLQRGFALLREVSGKGTVLSDVVAEDRAAARALSDAGWAKTITVSVVKPYHGRRIVRISGLK